MLVKKDGKATGVVLDKKELAKKNAERKEKLRAKKEIRDKKKQEGERIKREKEEKMIKTGEENNKRQPKLRKWATGEGGPEVEGSDGGQTKKVQRTGGKKGVG